MNNQLETLILQAYANFNDKDILILEHVAGRAFEGFKEMLNKKNFSLDDEKVIFFKDFTWFGSGSEGLLITDKSLYFKYWWPPL